MTMRMLIDARHREETRVAVVKGNRIEEFDFESAERKQLKGNIYLAKVTRVEPSLQAAFVDYGGNRTETIAAACRQTAGSCRIAGKYMPNRGLTASLHRDLRRRA